jgi:hypothetical protein
MFLYDDLLQRKLMKFGSKSGVRLDVQSKVKISNGDENGWTKEG